MVEKPTILCFTETWLNLSVRRLDISGYTVVIRRDRRDGRSVGGVIIFVASSCFDHVVPIYDSPSAERVWCLFHCHLGPLLVSCWYRPLEHGEILSIDTLRQEYLELRFQSISCVIVGDMNVHSISWLQYSRDSPEGKYLH